MTEPQQEGSAPETHQVLFDRAFMTAPPASSVNPPLRPATSRELWDGLHAHHPTLSRARHLGEALQQSGLVGRATIESALAHQQKQRRNAPPGEHHDKTLLGQILVRNGILSEAQLQAAIAACHARAPTMENTDWQSIAGLYSRLSALTNSPVVELNRAVAVAMVAGPAAGLDIVDALADFPALRGYHLLPSVRGDLLQRLGRLAEARAAFTAAAALAVNTRERALLERRAAACAR